MKVSKEMQRHTVPEATMYPLNGLLRVKQIIGNPKASPPIPPIIPVSRSSWWDGVKSGRFPQPIKLGPMTTCWRVSDIMALLEQGV
jgi:hypothetical protein